jgi:hypothetical protein
MAVDLANKGRKTLIVADKRARAFLAVRVFL